METMNPAGIMPGKSCGTDLRQCENQQDRLADLGPSGPGPPRVAPVAHQLFQHSPSYLQKINAAIQPTGTAQGHSPGDASPGPVRTAGQSGASPIGEAPEAPSDSESSNLLDLVANRLLSDDYEAYDSEDPDVRALMADYEATILGTDLKTGAAQGHPPPGKSPGPGLSPGHTGASLFGEALEAPYGGESGNPYVMVVNHLFSDHDEAYDPEDPNVRALMADYEATILGTDLNTGAAPKAGPGQEHPPVGESSRSGSSSGQLDATLPGGALDVSFGGEHAQEPTAPLVDPDHVREKMPVRGDCMAATGEQHQTILRIFETHPEKNNRSIADEFGISISTIQRLRKKFAKTGNLKPGSHANRLTGEQRQAIVQIFETDPKRSIQSIVDEFGVAYSTIHLLRKKYSKTGNLKPKESGKRLTGEQRQAILHIFETNPERSTQSIVDEFDVAYSTIHVLRKKFDKSGDLKPGNHANRLSADQRRSILHIFETDPARSNQDLADEFEVHLKTIQNLRKRFNKTGDLKPGDLANRLSADQRRSILHIFETDPKRSNQSVVDEFGVAYATIQLLRKKFSRTGNIKPGASGKHLSADQRRSILHIFKTDPERSNQSIADEFDVSYITIISLKRKFGKTGDLKPILRRTRLTTDQWQGILQAFETDPERSSQSIADGFNVTLKTIQRFRRRFRKTGHIKVGHHGKRLSADQRRAILQIFGTDPERSNQSIADEFGVTYSTILKFKKKVWQTGNIKIGDHANRLITDQHQAI